MIFKQTILMTEYNCFAGVTLLVRLLTPPAQHAPAVPWETHARERDSASDLVSDYISLLW